MGPAKPRRSYTNDLQGIGVLLEHLDSKIDLLTEGQVGLQRQINHLDDKMDGLRAEVNFKFGALHAEMNSRFETVDYRFDGVFEVLGEMRKDHQHLGARVAPLEKKPA